jgi:ATP-dependent Clp protease ATP-binding subunit ClpX
MEILVEPKNALIKQFQKIFRIEGVELEIREAALKAVARKALARKTGARGLRSIVEHVLLDIMYDLPSIEGLSQGRRRRESHHRRRQPLLIYAEQPKVAAPLRPWTGLR